MSKLDHKSVDRVLDRMTGHGDLLLAEQLLAKLRGLRQEQNAASERLNGILSEMVRKTGNAVSKKCGTAVELCDGAFHVHCGRSPLRFRPDMGAKTWICEGLLAEHFSAKYPDLPLTTSPEELAGKVHDFLRLRRGT